MLHPKILQMYSVDARLSTVAEQRLLFYFIVWKEERDGGRGERGDEGGRDRGRGEGGESG